MALDLSNDYKVLDGLGIVTLDGVVTALGVVYRQEVTNVEGDPTDGRYLFSETVFQLPTVPVITPRVGSVVTVGTKTYQVLEVREPYLGDYWGLTCRDSDITHDPALHDTVTLWPVVVTLADDGSRIAGHPLESADATMVDIRAKVQPMEGEIDVAAGKHQFRRRFEIYVAVEVTVLAIGDLIIDGHGNQYDVVSWRNRDRIDELSVIVAEYRD